MISRRDFLGTGTAVAALAALGFPESAFASGELKLGTEKSFSFDALVEQAHALASRAYEPPPAPPRDILERIDYQAHPAPLGTVRLIVILNT